MRPACRRLLRVFPNGRAVVPQRFFSSLPKGEKPDGRHLARAGCYGHLPVDAPLPKAYDCSALEARRADAMQSWNTAITDVRPNEIRLRGYRIDDLMGRVDFGRALHLLLRGELPAPGRIRRTRRVARPPRGRRSAPAWLRGCCRSTAATAGLSRTVPGRWRRSWPWRTSKSALWTRPPIKC